MQQRKYIVFKVLKQLVEEISLSQKKQKEFPVHEHYLTQVIETTFIYKYIPDKSLNEEKYILFWQNYLKKKHNALKVDYGFISSLKEL